MDQVCRLARPPDGVAEVPLPFFHPEKKKVWEVKQRLRTAAAFLGRWVHVPQLLLLLLAELGAQRLQEAALSRGQSGLQERPRAPWATSWGRDTS